MASRKKPAARRPKASRAGAARPAAKAKRAPAKKTISAKRTPRPLPAHPEFSQTKSIASLTNKQNNGAKVQPQDSGLTRKDIELFEQMLLQKRAQLLGDVTTLHNDALGKNRQDAAGDLSSMPIHMADLGTDNYEQEFTLGLIEGERAVLREIEEALERIRRGTFGLCLATGKPIGKARLRAKPWAKYCYEYTLAQERGRGRRI